jgi:TetR/AcrR family transcriptional regulator, tetracycline repressor protein
LLIPARELIGIFECKLTGVGSQAPTNHDPKRSRAEECQAISVTEGGTCPAERRGVGKRAGLDLARVVAAARSLDPGEVTMQAVADKLGVDRKALNHHVSDRENLLALVALDAFSTSFSTVQIGDDTPWQDACRAYAMGITDGVIAAGALAGHLSLGNLVLTRVLETLETVLQKLTAAGFDDETALRCVSLLSNICMGYARDTVLASSTGERPRPRLLRDALTERDPDSFETLTRIAAAGSDTYDKKQLELSIDVFLRGTEALLFNRKEAHRMADGV